MGVRNNPKILAVSCNNVCFSYPATDALAINQLSFDVTRGEILAVCGANGSGKTTLMKLLAGMLEPRSGTITVCGRRLDKTGRLEAFNYVGILFEDPNNQLFCTHVKEDVAYGPRNLGLDEEEVQKRVQLALEQTESLHLSDRPIHALSFGEMRRVALAGLIAMRPALLVLDEPTVGLDPASMEHLGSLIRKLNREFGYTVLVVTHDMSWGTRIAGRMLIMNSGRILADGPTRSILSQESILEKSRLKPPELAQLFNTLYQRWYRKGRNVPLNVEEAFRELEIIFQENRSNAKKTFVRNFDSFGKQKGNPS